MLMDSGVVLLSFIQITVNFIQLYDQKPQMVNRGVQWIRNSSFLLEAMAETRGAQRFISHPVGPGEGPRLISWGAHLPASSALWAGAHLHSPNHQHQ